ncbi:hypothetical protein NADE_002141 [Nannochloris sp. 'desiccata']|nr:hypothetical protein NADE_000484 [Chlorella desiccata (nom. nud.)]KAH7618883.1 hypothetical protein NADE_005732 [Chlorella desiccata (nom. nud.)]KAH7620375.1 hypothetical protein NADE_003000 [Chlorella desiccata (nom. nud.)]KAH7620909.1 hypothetical protein NADE_003518 [Chlorella desiccata (nom. nud.)]KAH7624353.1 hypothetical protein NADE_003706 [Chlorella desiccata (nom. nud.)]
MDTTRQTNDQDLVRTLVAQIFDRVMAVQHLQQPIDLTSSPFKEPALKKRKKGMEGEEKASWSAFVVPCFAFLKM